MTFSFAPRPTTFPRSPVSRPESIRLLVLDIDGTIAGESNTIREPVLAAIRAAQAAGVQVAIATGRMFCSAVRFHEAVGSRLPLIAYQGALIKDPQTQQVYRHWPLEAAMVVRILNDLEYCRWRSTLAIHVYLDDRLHVCELSPVTRRYAERSAIEPVVVGDLGQLLPQGPTKILVLSEDADPIAELMAYLRQRYTPAEVYLTRSVPTFLEASHPAVNKGTAVRYLAEELLGIPPSQVMAIGDNFNDMEMLQYAGLGIAMGNAPVAVQAIADWVAPSVEADGVAAAIAAFLL
ncbi:Cof-type HAD-IIB family hydrolase [Trichothermofontia sp.]